jgi:hypothetical protein
MHDESLLAQRYRPRPVPRSRPNQAYRKDWKIALARKRNLKGSINGLFTTRTAR